MLENLNLSLFSLINATPDSAPWMISLAIFIAKDLITVVPLLAAVLWLWGLTAQRQLVIKIAIALAVSLFVLDDGTSFSARPTLCRKYRL